MRRLHLLSLVCLLFCLGGGIFAYKHYNLGFPIDPRGFASVWEIEAKVSFETQGEPARLSFFLPRSTPRIAVLDEKFISQGFALTTVIQDGNRVAEWAIKKLTGRQVLYYHAVLRPVEHRGTVLVSKAPEVSPPQFEESKAAAARVVLEESASGAPDLARKVAALLKRVNGGERDDNLAFLLGEHDNAPGRLALVRDLLALSDISARVVHGIRLEETNRDAPLLHWLEVHDGRTWLSFDPLSGELSNEGEMLAWWRGDRPLSQIQGGTKLSTRVLVKRNAEEALKQALAISGVSSPALTEYSLFGLPLDTQLVYRVVLLVPIGALLIAFLRNVIGIETFGVFMPVLIALAFREMSLQAGIAYFVIVVTFGLLVRFYLEKLNLLVIPRLAAVLTVVVMLMAGTSILASKLGFPAGLSVALFPMVILTMTIERLSIVWEETGAAQAIQQCAGSLLAAACIWFVFRDERLSHLIFVFPELLLVVLGLLLLLGRYTGYRLLELIRFRELTH